MTLIEMPVKPMDSAIAAINALGGPPLPMGLDRSSARVALENQAAGSLQLWQVQIAGMALR